MLDKICYDVHIKQFAQVNNFDNYDFAMCLYKKDKNKKISQGSLLVANVMISLLKQNNIIPKILKDKNKLLNSQDLSELESLLAEANEQLKFSYSHLLIMNKLKPKIILGENKDMADTIKQLDFKLYSGECVGILGPVSSGKSSFLSALMGQMRISNTDNGRDRILNGKEDEIMITVKKDITYYPSEPVIFTGTIRDNILFGNEYEEKRYNKVLDLCCLRQDLEIMDSYDFTPVGEFAGTLSGGQKARVALARCAYSKAKIVLLDDCLSAVDAHVGFKIWTELITGFMREEKRTVVICTHQTHYFLSENNHRGVDRIFIINNGTISEEKDIELAVSGNDERKIQKKIISEPIVDSKIDSEIFATNEYKQIEEEKKEEKEKEEKEEIKSEIAKNSNIAGTGTFTVEKIEEKRKTLASLYTEEKKSGHGSISCKVYSEWCKELKYFGFIVYILLACFGLSLYFFQVIELQEWATGSSDLPILPKETSSMVYLWIFVGCTLASFLVLSIAGVVIAFNWYNSTLHLGEKMLSNILHSPVRYFDVTPTGRLINHMSRDLDSLESTSIKYLFQTIFNLIQLFGMVIIISISSYISIVILIPCLDTIIKYDKVCVINEGSVAEYASPADLIKDSTSIFYSLCKRTGDKSFKYLYKMACDAEYHHSTHDNKAEL